MRTGGDLRRRAWNIAGRPDDAFAKHVHVRGYAERRGVSVDFVPNGIDNVSLVVPTEAIAPKLYTILAEIQSELEPDKLEVLENVAIVAAVGHRMAFRPGVSGKIFAALGEAGINIRMINQGPDELNIIFGVDNRDFAEAIRVLYNSFAK